MGIANWEWFGLPCYALVLTVFIPIYLKNRVTTVPGFLADRFGPACGTIYSCMLLAFYVCIYTVTVLYAGSLAFSQVTGWNFYFVLALIVVGVGAYSIHGGLTSVMWADLFQCVLLMVGGITLFFAALGKIPGGWDAIVAANPERMHLYQPPGHEMAPFMGMIIATFGAFTFYQVGNQAMIQRMLAARTTWDALMERVFAQFINFLRPLVTCFLGLVVYHWIFVMKQHAPLEKPDSGTQIRVFEGRKKWVSSVAFSPDGKWILTGCKDKSAILWDAKTGLQLRTFQGHRDSVTSVAFSRDSKRVLADSSDKTAILWNADRGEQIRVFTGTKGWVSSVAFNPSGSRVLTGSSDYTAILWEAEDATDGAKDDTGKQAASDGPLPATDRTAWLAEWEKLKYGMFIHFGMSTFTGDRFGIGAAHESPSTYAPSQLDVKQWIQVAKRAGMKYAVLTAKHHSGFCLWPSEVDDYSVKSGGDRTDVVAEFMKACKEEGVKPGLYYSIVDELREGKADFQAMVNDAYFKLIQRHITELHTRYRDPGVAEQWFGHAYKLDSQQRRELYELVKKSNPNCIVTMQGPFDPNGTQVPPQSFPADVCSPDETVSIDRSYDAVKELDGKTYYLPLEVGNALTKNWFWTPKFPAQKSGRS